MTASDAGTRPASPLQSAGSGAGRARLQVALDFAILQRALKAADEAVAGGAELIEAGTPLLKSEGLEAVRQLKARFPGIPIVADTKTMDAGRIEMAAKAGASFATVLGAAAPGTIRECVEVGRNYGIAVIVDLVNVPDPVAAARSAEQLGAAAVNVHCGIDQQMLGQDPFATLTRVRQAVGLTVFVAGGINSESAATAARAGADVVVVGGAITKAADATAAARAVVQALREGRSQATGEFRRYGPEQIREAYLKASTPNISDAMHRGGVLAGLVSFVPGLKTAGRALTVRTYPGDWAKPV